MSCDWSRRRFLAQTSLSVSSSALLPGLTPLTQAGMALDTQHVRFQPDIEPLVRLIEDTPRSELMETIGQRVQSGTGYSELLAGLFLAAIRNVQPRPHVGFKFHAVLVVHSAHLAAISSAPDDRWLPIFWALDEFKSSQARDVREGDWTMAAVDEAAVPSAEHAVEEFQQAMENWDEMRADSAAAGLVRSAEATQVFELFARYAARDYRSIGHKAIYAANAWRTLETIGWQHAEPVFRSLAYAMLNHHGEPNPSTSDLSADRAWRSNQQLADTIREDWLQGRDDASAARSLMQVLRTGSSGEASQAVVERLNAGVSVQSVFDALHTRASEMLLQQTGIIALHAVTTTNAIRFLFDTSADPQTRRLLLLQNAAFLPLFRMSMQGRGQVGRSTVQGLQGGSVSDEDATLERIFLNVGRNRQGASQGAWRYLQQTGDSSGLITAARQLIFLKGSNSHDYKFSSALLEDYAKVSPEFRDQFLAAGSVMLRGSSAPDNGLVARIRDAIG